MIEVTSYLRAADGEFSRVEEVASAPRDPRYVEGAIELTIDGAQLIGTAMWDYVDQLWAYLSDMVLAFQSQDEVSTYFPDQPIKLVFSRLGGGGALVVVEMEGEVRRAAIAENKLVDALRTQGAAFFWRMIELLPQNSDSYRDSLSRLMQNNRR